MSTTINTAAAVGYMDASYEVFRDVCNGTTALDVVDMNATTGLNSPLTIDATGELIENQ